MWGEYSSKVVTVIPDDPPFSSSSSFSSAYPYSSYPSSSSSQGVVLGEAGEEHLSMEEKTAIKGVFNSIENARSLHEELQTPELKITLLKHQRQGLSWMVKQEESDHRGGILADEMGLGKTVQSIALILKNKPTNPKKKCTLIVAPLAVMKQVRAHHKQQARCKH